MTHRKLFRMCAAIAAAVAILVTIRGQTASAAEKLVVHEWGTFTSLQDENGRQLGGINVDDEPVPSFVYGYKFGRPSQLHPQHAYGTGRYQQGCTGAKSVCDDAAGNAGHLLLSAENAVSTADAECQCRFSRRLADAVLPIGRLRRARIQR